MPTTVSAIKVDGKRAYALARAGEQVDLKARPVTVSEFTVHTARATTAVAPPPVEPVETPPAPVKTPAPVETPTPVEPVETPAIPVLDVDVTVTVSSGTYVRALARDLGAALGSAGHLTALRRTRVGGHTLADARTLEAMEAQADADGVLATIPLADAARATFPVRPLSADEARDLGYGRPITPTGRAETVAAIGPDGALVALLEDSRRRGEDLARPVLVLAAA